MSHQLLRQFPWHPCPHQELAIGLAERRKINIGVQVGGLPAVPVNLQFDASRNMKIFGRFSQRIAGNDDWHSVQAPRPGVSPSFVEGLTRCHDFQHWPGEPSHYGDHLREFGGHVG